MTTEDTKRARSPLTKLFSPNALRDKELQKIRDRIYSYAWSRDRRDEAKLDWVVSENGVDRNVHLKWIDETSSGKLRHHIDGLPCWLHLVNKQISADFTRFIYSVNSLDVLVDLKADPTEPNEAKLDMVVRSLQSTNFQHHTRSARVRIHFPDKYPFENLPAFNQHALDNIAKALDRFKQLNCLCVRVVPMQGPEIYELRLATFPFYPMAMTNWSIRMLNSNTCNWDLVGGEQLHHLNLAWDVFQESGSLTMAVPAAGDTKRSTSHIDQGPAEKSDRPAKKPPVAQQRNGSQKRKDRKLKALSTMLAPNASKTSSGTTSQGPSLRSRSTSSGRSKDPRSISVSGNDKGAGEEPACVTLPTAEPLETGNTLLQHARPADLTNTASDDHLNQEEPEVTSPSISVASSVTLGRDQSEDEAAAIHAPTGETLVVETCLRGAGVDSEKPPKKKRKNRKKGKKVPVTDTAAISPIKDGSQQVLSGTEDNSRAIFFSTDASHGIITTGAKWDGLMTSSTRTFPLADIAELSPLPEHQGFLRYTRVDGSCGLITRDPDLNRLLRQKERLAARETERKAEQERAKGKRKTKKVKEVLIRRKGPLVVLRSKIEDKQELGGGGQRGSDLKKRIKEIPGECRQSTVSVSTDTSGGFYSGDDDDFFPEDERIPSEEASSPQRDPTIHREDLGNSSISHRGRSTRTPVSTLPQPLQVFIISTVDAQDQKNSQAETQDIAGLEELDDCASTASQYGDEGPPLFHDGED